MATIYNQESYDRMLADFERTLRAAKAGDKDAQASLKNVREILRIASGNPTPEVFDAMSAMTAASERVNPTPPRATSASLTKTTESSQPMTWEQMKDRFSLLGRSTGLGLGFGAAGALLVREHRVLGFLGGSALGYNIPQLFNKDTRTSAICDLISHAAAIGGSLAWEEHPVWGYIFGHAAGLAVTSFVPGNNSAFKALADHMQSEGLTPAAPKAA